MSWSEIFSRASFAPKKQLAWGCSQCSRRFARKENVRCHVLRNNKCSSRMATEVYLSDLPIVQQSIENPNVRVQPEGKENEEIPQRPARVKKKRTGVRPFPPPLIARVVAEGKKIAETNGRRETVRILLQSFPMANLSASTIDRWIYVLSAEKLSSIIKLARQKGTKLRLPANLKEMSKSRISRPDLESQVYLKYRHRRDTLKLRINFS